MSSFFFNQDEITRVLEQAKQATGGHVNTMGAVGPQVPKGRVFIMTDLSNRTEPLGQTHGKLERFAQ